MSELPPSLAWVPLFAASANRALDGDIIEMAVTPTVDPLQWVLVARLSYRWTAQMSAMLRHVLDAWCSANEAGYVRAGIGKNATCWYATLLLKGLGPEQRVNPYEDDSVEIHRARRRLRCATRE